MSTDQPGVSPVPIAEVRPVLTEKQQELCHKDLRDEIQLYWLIQLGTITALGALMGTWPKTDAISSIDGTIVKLLVLSVAMILITVAGMYNVVGNYYTFVANFRLGREFQESVVTPWLAFTQSIIAAILGVGIGAILLEGNFNPPQEVTSVTVMGAKVEATKTAGSAVPANAISTTTQVERRWWGWRLFFVPIGAVLGFSVYGYAIASAVGVLLNKAGHSMGRVEVISQFERYSHELQSTCVVWWGKLMLAFGRALLWKSNDTRRSIRKWITDWIVWSSSLKID